LQARVYVALAVLLLGVVAVAVVALAGGRSMLSSSTDLYHDNLLTGRALGDVRTSMEGLHEGGLTLLLAADAVSRRQGVQELIDGAAEVDARLSTLQRLQDPQEREERERIDRLARQWAGAREVLLVDVVAYGGGDAKALDKSVLETLLHPMLDELSELQREELVDAEAVEQAGQDAGRRTGERIAVLTVLVLLTGVLASTLLVRTVRASLTDVQLRRQEEQQAERVQAELTEALQSADDQGEAQELLRRHLERAVPDITAVVLNRNNSANRLTAATTLTDGSPLRRSLEGVTPRSCLAVRFGRAYTPGTGTEPLLPCQVCHSAASAVSCQPLLVGGEVIGSVLVSREEAAFADGEVSLVRNSVSRAAPVLANLRNLALAEVRAATDQLTGMPNSRSVQDTLLRMTAQAGRTLQPLSAVMLDLDHFKGVNDGWGHPKGDEVLAAVGAALRQTVRRSDFIGRYGGEEFLALLPDTDRAGALLMAEKLRAAVEGVRVAGLDRAVTVSAGVATLPDDAADGSRLLRAADRVLYAAKANGRNRVEPASVVPAPATPA
jgi:diguanylate cyclase (GGDEF)-like protein